MEFIRIISFGYWNFCKVFASVIRAKVAGQLSLNFFFPHWFCHLLIVSVAPYLLHCLSCGHIMRAFKTLQAFLHYLKYIGGYVFGFLDILKSVQIL